MNKTIHYCWFGRGRMTNLNELCIGTWRKYAPDYELKLWSEDNMPRLRILNDLLSKKQYAFASDIVRLYAVANEGGIYLDTDIELIKSLEHLPNDFIAKENADKVNSAVCGSSEENHPFFLDALATTINYFEKNIIKYSPEICSEVMERKPYRIEVLEKDYFFPFNPYLGERKNFMSLDIKENTIGIHHFQKSWELSLMQRLIRQLKLRLNA